MKKILVILSVLTAMAVGGVMSSTASAAASCTPSASPFVPSWFTTEVAAQMTLSNCTDTKAVQFASISALVADPCLPTYDCQQAHFEELIGNAGWASCHMAANTYYQRQDWNCGNATGTIGSASIYQYVYRPDIGFALTPHNSTYISVQFCYKLQSYSTGSWDSFTTCIATPFTFVQAP